LLKNIKTMEAKRTYPQEVENKIDICMESITLMYDGVELDFSKPEHHDILRETIGEVIFNQWVNGNIDEMPFDIDGLIDLIKITTIKCVLFDLKQRGLIDEVEDDNGNTVFFATEKAKSTVYPGLASEFYKNLNFN